MYYYYCCTSAIINETNIFLNIIHLKLNTYEAMPNVVNVSLGGTFINNL